MKKVLSILLAVVFFISSTGFTISSHKCGGEIHKQSLDFVAVDLNCGMEASNKGPCENSLIKDNCCQNEFQSFKVTDEFQTTTEEVKLHPQFLIAFTTTFFNLISVENNTYNKYSNYSPPLPEKDIPVLIQSFRI